MHNNYVSNQFAWSQKSSQSSYEDVQKHNQTPKPKKKKNLKKEKKNPPNRIRTSDLRISALPLQSSALPTELSAVTLKCALYLSFYCTLGHLSMNLHKSLSIFCPWRKYDIINNSYLSFWHFFSHFSMFIIAKNKLNSLKNSK